MTEAQPINLNELLGRKLPEVLTELHGRNVAVETVAEKVPGPLTLLLGLRSPAEAPPGARIRAYTVGDEIVRFEVDEAATLHSTLAADRARIAELERRVGAVEQELRRLRDAAARPAEAAARRAGGRGRGGARS